MTSRELTSGFDFWSRCHLTWNIRTLSSPGSARLLTNELYRAKISIMALQGVRWSDAGETTVAGYTFLWSGPPIGEFRRAGVALAVDRNALGHYVHGSQSVIAY